MIYNENKVSGVNIAYIGGGSRGWAWKLMNDLALEEDIVGTVKLYDIDNEAAINNKIIAEGINSQDAAISKWNYEVHTSLESALTNADFVIISILPGTFNEMDSDVHLPERYGIYQSVGDTVGPGGIIRSLRTIPMIREIALSVEKYAKDAWVINYTNPMSLCVKTLYETFPKIKAFGCCHEVFGTQKVLKEIVEQKFNLEDIKREDIHVNVLGINHFTWFDKASYKAIDIFPVYKKFIDENFENGYDEKGKDMKKPSFECSHRVKFDLFNKYGLIAAAGDRHLAEFMPGAEYLKDKETVQKWKFGLTTVDYRKSELLDRLEESKRLVNGGKADIVPSGEEGVLLIKALLGLTRVVSNVNIPNINGQINNINKTTVVETNAVFSRDSIAPIFAGEIPTNILELMNGHIENQELVYQAATQFDINKVITAFKNDALVKDRICDNEIETLVKDMINNTLEYLPEQWKNLVM